jgi:hypothetical protein
VLAADAGRPEAEDALRVDALNAGGSTAGGQGLALAYQMAEAELSIATGSTVWS